MSSWFSSSPEKRRSSAPATPRSIDELIAQHSLTPSVLNGYIHTTHSPLSNSSVSKYLLPADTCTFLHKSNTSTQVIHYYSGGSAVLVELDKARSSHVRFTTLGGNNVQHVVEKGTWWGMYCDDSGRDAYSLLGITSLPDCNPDYDIDFAAPSSLIKSFPKAKSAIERLTQGHEEVLSNYERERVKNRRSSKARGSFVGGAQSNSDHTSFRSTGEKPRQLLYSLTALAAILYFFRDDVGKASTPSQAFQLCMGAVFVAFQVFVFLQIRDLITVFPHPGFWRLIFGWGAFYAFLIVAMLALQFKDARWIMESLMSDFGTYKQWMKDVEANKAETMGSCDVSFMTIFKQIFFAPWFLSHALGWMGKMMVFRDWGVCLIAALMFEFLELTFTYEGE